MKIKTIVISVVAIIMFSSFACLSEQIESVYISNDVIFFPNQETAKIGDSWQSVKGAFERSKYACQDVSKKPDKFVNCTKYIVLDYVGEARHEIQILVKNGLIMDIEWVQIE